MPKRLIIFLLALCLTPVVAVSNTPLAGAQATELECSVAGDGVDFVVSWNLISGATKYVVRRTVDGDPNGPHWRGVVDDPGVSFTDTHVDGVVDYFVVAKDGNTELSQAPCDVGSSPEPELPTQCGFVVVDDEIVVVWTEVSLATRYVVRRTVNQDPNGPHWRGSVDVPDFSFTDTAIEGEIEYFLDVKDDADETIESIECPDLAPSDTPSSVVLEDESDVLPVWMSPGYVDDTESYDYDTGIDAYDNDPGEIVEIPDGPNNGGLLLGPFMANIAGDSGTVYQQDLNGPAVYDDLKHWKSLYFPVVSDPTHRPSWKLQVEVYRVGDQEDLDSPYYKRVSASALGTVQGELRASPQSFQPGYEYKWRYRTWPDGSYWQKSGWTWGDNFTISAATGKPGAPYPKTPVGVVSPTDVILRLSKSETTQSESGRDIDTYRFEIYDAGVLATEAALVWETDTVTLDTIETISGPVVQIQVPNESLKPDSKYRWRAVAIDSSGEESSPSRWRYFRTTGPDFQDEKWYVSNRAGSYKAGDDGNEVSGMVASVQYPGIYWMIRDNGPGDRSRLYAIKIDPDTGLLANLDGYSTKEIDVVESNGGEVENIDWEAITIDPNNNLWVADSGAYWDGSSQTRPYGQFLKLAEPNPYDTETFTANISAIYKYVFPDGNTRNVEAVFSVGHHKFLIRKEPNHSVWRFPRWPTSGNNVLDYQGTLGGNVGNVTGAELKQDRTLFAVTTSPKTSHFWQMGGTPLDLATVTSTQAEALIDPILINAPDSYYYYRSAALLEEQGILDETRGNADQIIRQTFMQTEGIAFGPGDSRTAAMVSEYGRHVMYVPESDYTVLEGEPGDNSGGGALPSVAGIVQPLVQSRVLSGQISREEGLLLDAPLTVVINAEILADLDGAWYFGTDYALMTTLVKEAQSQGLGGQMLAAFSPSIMGELIRVFEGHMGQVFQVYNPLHKAVQYDIITRAHLGVRTSCGVLPGFGQFRIRMEVGTPSGLRMDLVASNAEVEDKAGNNILPSATHSIVEVKYNTAFSQNAALAQLAAYYVDTGFTHIDPSVEELSERGCWDIRPRTTQVGLGLLPLNYRQNRSVDAAAFMPAGSVPSGVVQGRVGYWIDKDKLLEEVLAGATGVAARFAWQQFKEQELNPPISGLLALRVVEILLTGQDPIAPTRVETVAAFNDASEEFGLDLSWTVPSMEADPTLTLVYSLLLAGLGAAAASVSLNLSNR